MTNELAKQNRKFKGPQFKEVWSFVFQNFRSGEFLAIFFTNKNLGVELFLFFQRNITMNGKFLRTLRPLLLTKWPCEMWLLLLVFGC